MFSLKLLFFLCPVVRFLFEYFFVFLLELGSIFSHALTRFSNSLSTQTFPTRVHLSDLDLPQHALHKILEVGGGIHHSHTLIFEVKRCLGNPSRQYVLRHWLLPYACHSPLLCLPYACHSPLLCLPYACYSSLLCLPYACHSPFLCFRGSCYSVRAYKISVESSNVVIRRVQLLELCCTTPLTPPPPLYCTVLYSLD